MTRAEMIAWCRARAGSERNFAERSDPNKPERKRAILDEAERFEAIAARLEADAELEAALREWVGYFDEIDRTAMPGDPLAAMRHRVHSARLNRSRAALAGEGGKP